MSEDLKSNLSTEFLVVAMALLEETYTYEATYLNNAISVNNKNFISLFKLLFNFNLKDWWWKINVSIIMH